MATLGTEPMTLSDWAKRLDPNGDIVSVIEALEKECPILDDIPWFEGNLPTGHMTMLRNALPDITTRAFNQGVKPTKGGVTKVTEAVTQLASLFQADRDLLRLSNKRSEYLASESKGFLQAFNHGITQRLFYGSLKDNPAEIDGFFARYKPGAYGASNVITAGGTGSSNASVMLVGWSKGKIAGFFPKGFKAGFEFEVKDGQTLLDADGGKYLGTEVYYYWNLGLAVEDYRYGVRVANIPMSGTGAITSDPNGAVKLIELMIRASERIQGTDGVRPVFYCNRTIREFLRLQIVNKGNVNLTFDTVAGKRVLMFDGIPVRRVDALLNTEEAV